MEKKGFKVVGELLTKTVGLVFFSLLAIGLGVLFGVLFEGMLRENPEDTAIVQTQDPVLETTPYAPEEELTTSEGTPGESRPVTAPGVMVVSKVLVGPFATYQEASAAADKLKTDGYPTYVVNKAPYAVQVGAFSNSANAENLKNELAGKGYKSFVRNE